MRNRWRSSLLLLFGAIVWYALSGHDVDRTAPSVEAVSVPSPPVVAAPPPAAAPRSDALPVDSVHITGRCVDASGAPIAGCGIVRQRVRVPRAQHPADYDRVFGTWLAEQPDDALAPCRGATGADGRFAATVAWAPTGWQFEFDAGARRAIARVDATRPGQRVDLGDVPLVARVLLRGEVVDAERSAVPFAWVAMLRDGQVVDDTASDDTGRFEMQALAGAYEFVVDAKPPSGGRSTTIPPDVAAWHVTLTVDGSGSDAVSGAVVDEDGAPLAKVIVCALGDPEAVGFTDSAGRFAVRRRTPAAADAGPLTLSRDGLEPWLSTDRYAWGTRNLVLRMRRGVDVDVRVTAARDGRPVSSYTARAMRQVVVSGYHADGAVRMQGLARGANWLLVQPDRWDAASCALALDLPVVGSVHVAVPPAAERPVRLVRPDGAPVAAAGVELVDPLDREVDAATAVTRDVAGLGAACLLVQRGETNPAGELVLRGRSDTPLVLRVLGRSGGPVALFEVQLGEPGTAVLTLDATAGLEGRLGPPDVVAALREASGLTLPTDRATATDPGLRLRGGTGSIAQVVPPIGQPPVAVDENGAFRFVDVPAGQWSLVVDHWQAGHRGRIGGVEPLAEVELRHGDTRSLNVDAAHLTSGHLTGTVLERGTPLANAAVWIAVEDGARRASRRWTYAARTDGAGRFEADVRTGRARVGVGPHAARARFAATEVAIVPGGRATGSFDLRKERASLVVVDDAGQPRSGVTLFAVTPDGWLLGESAPTDAAGATSLELGDEPVSIQVLPRSKATAAARRAIARLSRSAADPFAGQRLEVGRFDASTESAERIRRLVLPSAWGQ